MLFEIKDTLYYRCMHASHIGDIFLHYFRRHHDLFVNEFKKVICNTASIDHTFYCTTLIKIISEDVSKKQFSALLIVTNEDGLICRFMLCRSLSLDELEDVLKELARTHPIKIVYTDDCCATRNILLDIFGDVEVYLDLFHATQRVTRVGFFY